MSSLVHAPLRGLPYGHRRTVFCRLEVPNQQTHNTILLVCHIRQESLVELLKVGCRYLQRSDLPCKNRDSRPTSESILPFLDNDIAHASLNLGQGFPHRF
jgi:hypothetical protein